MNKLSFKFKKLIKKILDSSFTAKIKEIFLFLLFKFKQYINSFVLKYKFIFKKKNGSLLVLANKEVKGNKKLRREIYKDQIPLWMPSVASFLRVSLVMLFFWIISHPKYILDYIFSPINSLLSNLHFYKIFTSYFIKLITYLPSFSIPLISKDIDFVAIHTGIGAVLIGLAFFVAQSLTDKSDPERAKVLLYKSWFFPLLMAEVMTFFFFIGETNVIAFFPVFFIALWTIFSLGNVIEILVKEHKMEQAKKEVILSVTKKSFIKILDREITERIANNIINKKYENSEILNVNPFGFFDKKDSITINSLKSGLIIDIKLNELDKFVFELNKAMNGNAVVGAADSTSNESLRTKKDSLCCLKVLLGRKIEVGETLFEINKTISRTIDIKKLEKISKDIFIIKNDDLENEARTEILKLKDRAIFAINNQQTGELEKIMKLYVDLIDEYFKYFNLYHGGCFSSEQARQERGSFFDRLQPLEWISKDVWEIFERGINSSDINIIRDVAYLPILLAQQAIESKDHLIFQEFILFPGVLYEKALELSESGNNKESKFMFDRTWRYLKELSIYHLESKLKDDDYPEQDFKDYYIQILQTFQNLLKKSFDKKDLENFEKFLSVVSDLFNRLSEPYEEPSLGEETIYNYLNSKRQEMFFGVASWILSILKTDIENQTVKQFYNSIQSKFPPTIEDFVGVFLKSHDFKIEDFWGWDNWEMRPDEGVHSINVLEKLEQFFVVKSLSILRSKTDVEIQNIQVPYNRDLAFLAEGTRDMIKTIDDIEKNPTNWNFVLDAVSISKCSLLRDLLRKAHEQQEQDDLKFKRETKISQEKVEKFKQSMIINYTQSHPIKELLKNFNLYVDKKIKHPKKELGKMGINTLFDKAAFFEDNIGWHVHYTGIDEAFGFGRSMSLGENDRIIEEIDKKVELITADNFNEKLSLLKTSDMFIVATNSAVWKFFERSSDKYIPKWRQDFPKEFAGSFVDGVINFKKSFIPVYRVITQNADHSKIYILDKTKFGKFIQYSPLDKEMKPGACINDFFIDVQEFIDESDLINEFLNNPPQWLIDVGDRGKQEEYLKEKVLIHIFEKFEFVVSEKFQGYVLLTDKAKS